MEIRTEMMDRLKARNTSIEDFNFDSLWAPPLLSLLMVEDIEYFRKLATSLKYSAKINFKYSEIDRVMKMRGFVKLGAGTNRVVYRYLENNQICIKIAIDDVGMKDNPREFKNQELFKPFVCKIFEVSPCGTVALVERVEPIRSREEFMSIACDIYDMLSKWFIGKYVLEDIGTDKFMNFGCRKSFGPVLIDFPYVYELDGAKLYCSLIQDDGQICNGEIDYDDGFKYLCCTKCGAQYKGIELQKAVENNNIIKEKVRGKEGSRMKVMARYGTKVVKTIDPDNATKKVISKREKAYNARAEMGSGIKVRGSYTKGGIVIPEEVKEAVKDIKEDPVDINEVVSQTASEIISGTDEGEDIENAEEAIVTNPDVLEALKDGISEALNEDEIRFSTDSTFIPSSDIPSEIAIDIEDDGDSECDDGEVIYTSEDAFNEAQEQILADAQEYEEDLEEQETPAPEAEIVDAPKKRDTKRSKRFDPEYYGDK